MKKICFFLLAIFIAGCASQPAKITQTKSGYPEVEIVTTDLGRAKDGLISIGVENGYALKSESDRSIVMVKEVESVMAQAFLTAGTYGTKPVMEMRYTLIKRAGSVQVVSTFSVSSQNVYGQTSSNSGMNNASFNKYQAALNALKAEIEAGR